MEDLNFSIDDKKRIVLRKILTDEVKNFNSFLFSINGDPTIYQKAFSIVYDELFTTKPDIDSLSSEDLRRLSFALNYSVELLRDKLISNAQRFNDYSNHLDDKIILKTIQRATNQSSLLYIHSNDDKYANIKKIIKNYSKAYKLNTTLAKQGFYLESKRNSSYYNEKKNYQHSLREFLYTLKRLGIEDKRDINDILKTLNKSFFKISNNSWEIEPIHFIANKKDKYLCLDYLKLNTLKFEYANNLIKYLPQSTFQNLMEIMMDNGVSIRDYAEKKVGKCPEDTVGFYNSYLLNVVNNENELSQ